MVSFLLSTFRTYGRFTMEVILTSAFGVQANVQMDPNNEYTRHAETLFQVGLVSPLSSKIHLPAQQSRFINTAYHYNHLIIIISVSKTIAILIHTFRILSLFAVPACLVSLSAYLCTYHNSNA